MGNPESLFVAREYILQKYCKQHLYAQFVQALDSKGLLEHTSSGNLKEQAWSCNSSARPRGVFLIWEKLFSGEDTARAEIEDTPPKQEANAVEENDMDF